MRGSYELDQLAAAADKATAALEQIAGAGSGTLRPDGGFGIGDGEGPSGSGGAGGGFFGGRARGRLAGGLLGAAGSAANTVGAELGGSFAGFGNAGPVTAGQVGGSFDRAQLSFLSSIPLLGGLIGNATGATQAEGVLGRSEGRLNAFTDDLARSGIKPDPQGIGQLADLYVEEETRVEEQRLRNRRTIGLRAADVADESLVGSINEGISDALAPVVGKFDELIAYVRGILG